MMRRSVALILSLGSVLGLGGCAFSEQPATSQPLAAAPEPAPIPAPMPVAYQPEPVKPVVPVPQPQSLIGLDGMQIEALLGTPAFVRIERPAEIWQYRAENCVVDFYFYSDGAVDRVTYMETRDGQAVATAADRCLTAVVAARAQPRYLSAL